MIYQSETIDHTYLSLEIKDGHGVLYEIYQRDEVFDTSHVADIYISDDSERAEHDADLDWWQLEFLQSLFTNIQKI
jgi:hypothetical protein